MIETLYKTETPVRGESECYVLVLTSRASTGRKIYAFMQEHGQWDETLESFAYKVDSIGASDTLTRDEGLALYEEAKHRLSSKGFVHAFQPDFVRNGPQNYRYYAAEEAVPA